MINLWWVNLICPFISFFKKIDKPFSELVPSINTEENILSEREIAEVSTSLENHEKSGKKRGAYKKFKPEDRREIGKSASIHGVSQTIKRLSERYPSLSKQTVSEFKKAYVSLKTNGEDNPPGEKRSGRPALLPDDLMKKTIKLIEALRLKGAPVTSRVVNSVVRGIITANDR